MSIVNWVEDLIQLSHNLIDIFLNLHIVHLLFSLSKHLYDHHYINPPLYLFLLRVSNFLLRRNSYAIYVRSHIVTVESTTKMTISIKQVVKCKACKENLSLK